MFLIKYLVFQKLEIQMHLLVPSLLFFFWLVSWPVSLSSKAEERILLECPNPESQQTQKPIFTTCTAPGLNKPTRKRCWQQPSPAAVEDLE